MRHKKSGRHLNRTSAHRKAMFRNMAASLIEHEVIKTTVPKAKELRRVSEPLITLAKEDSVANRRLAFDRLRNKAAVGKLFAELGPRYRDRPGGYTRILKAGLRAGDAAPVAYVELVDRPVDFDEDLYDETYDDAEAADEDTAESFARAEEVEDAEIVEETEAEAQEEGVQEAEAAQEETTAEDADEAGESDESGKDAEDERK